MSAHDRKRRRKSTVGVRIFGSFFFGRSMCDLQRSEREAKLVMATSSSRFREAIHIPSLGGRLYNSITVDGEAC